MLRLLILLLAIQDQPVQGPLSDALERRIELWRTEEEKSRQLRFNELMQAITELREQREGLFSGLKEFRNERDGLLSKLAEVRSTQNGILGRLEGIHARFDSIDKRWTPIQNLVDRVTGLVWKLLGLLILLFIFTIVICSVGLFLYVRLKSKLLALAEGK